jgi:integrase
MSTILEKDNKAPAIPDYTPKITYEAVLTAALKDAAPTSQKAKDFRAGIKHWLKYHHKAFPDKVGEEFGPLFETHLSRMTEEMLLENPTSRRSDNVRWVAGLFRQAYQTILLDDELPTDFLAALTVLRLRKTWSVEELVHLFHAAIHPTSEHRCRSPIYRWLRGEAHPSYREGNSAKNLQVLEEILGVPTGTLSTRAFKRVTPILTPGIQKNAYRDNQAIVTAIPFVMEMPVHIEEAFKETTAWKRKKTHRVAGETYALGEGNYWTSAATVEINKRRVGEFFSYLMLPATTEPEYKLTTTAKASLGKGLAPEELRYTMLLDPELLWEFFEFKRNRQVNQVFTRATEHFLVLVNNLVNHPHSFIRAHPKFGAEQSPPVGSEDWQAHCEEWHQAILKLAREIKKAIPAAKQRDPDTGLRSFLDKQSPVALLKEMTQRMYSGVTPSSHKKKRALEFRDALLFDLMVAEPLRASHWGQLELGEDLVRNENGVWELIVDKARFKNKASVWCKDRRIRLSLRISGIIDEYLEQHRPHLRGVDVPGEKRVFLSGRSGQVRKERKIGDHPNALSPQTLYRVVCNRFNTYFGIRVGPHSFRHILATAYLMEHPGDYEGAASILNNSPDVVKKNYGHLTQADHLRRADAWREDIEDTFQRKVLKDAKEAAHG